MKDKTRRWVKLLLILSLPVILIAGYVVYESLPTVCANRTLSNANLAPLPESYYDLNAWQWSFIFSGSEYLKFKASPEDIERFIASSPILRGNTCVIYGDEKQRLPRPRDFGTKQDHFSDRYEFYSPDPSAPDWYITELKGAGRRYEIKPLRYQCPGEVIIDDESGTVFVKLVFS